jgi:hypothetical protein
VIAKTTAGPAFAPVGRYLAGRNSGTDPVRVAWISSRNLPVDEPALAAELMQATASQNPRVESPAYHMSLSFAPEDHPTRDLMEQVTDRVLSDLGLSEYQALLVAHHDRQHAHVHVLVNRVHPETLAAWDRWHDHVTLDRVLAAVETEHGLRRVPERDERLTDRSSTIALSREPARTPTPDERPLIARVRELLPDIRAAHSWHELRDHLRAHGVELERRAHGLVLSDGTSHVKASRVAADTSLARLETRLGPYTPGREPDQVTGQAPSAYEIARATDAATQRLRHAEWAVERAARSAADVERALAAAFVDPPAARSALALYDAAHGADRAATALREHPEQFGALATVERRRAFGLWISADDRPARDAASEAAALVRESIDHGRQARGLLQLQPGASNDAVRAALAELRTSTADILSRLPRLAVAAIAPALTRAIERTAVDVLRGREHDRE